MKLQVHQAQENVQWNVLKNDGQRAVGHKEKEITDEVEGLETSNAQVASIEDYTFHMWVHNRFEAGKYLGRKLKRTTV